MNGAVSGTITVQSTSDLSNVYLAIDSVSPSAGFRTSVAPEINAAVTSGGGVLGFAAQPLAAYQQPTGSWHHPFRGVNYAISGNYGEWRPKTGDPAGRPHEGLDFAAPVTTKVYPVAGGVVARVSDVVVGGALGKLVVINHGNGYASRYLHIKPSVKEDQPVTTNTVIGEVTTLTAPGVGAHLHLEMRQNCKVYYRATQPGKPVGAAFEIGASPGPGTHYDPLRDNALFDSPLVVGGVNDSAAPRIRALNFFAPNYDPRSAYFPALATGVGPGSGAVYIWPGSSAAYLVAEVVDGDGSYTLAPSRVKLVIEDPASGSLTNVLVDQTFNDSAIISRLFQNTTPRPEFGYPRIPWGSLFKQDRYPFWFALNTSGYAAYPNGPRQVQLTISDRTPRQPTIGLWKFGPELTNPVCWIVDPAAPNGTAFTLTAKSYMGPFPAAQLAQTGGPRDEITFSFQGGMTSWDAFFVDSTNGSQEVTTLKQTFISDSSGVKQDTVQVRVKKKPGAATPTAWQVKSRRG